MYKKYLIAISLIIACFSVWGQYTIQGTIIGVQPENILLLKTLGSKQTIIDSTRIDETGSYRLSVPVETEAGQYQLFTESGVSLDIIYNKENIRLIALYDGYDQQVQVIESEENRVYYEFSNLKRYNLLKLDILSTVLDYYPREDPFYQKTTEKALELRSEINTMAYKLVENNPNLLATHFIKATMPVFASINLSEDQKRNYLKAHYFDHINFSDTVLVNSQILNSKIINYLSLYQDQDDDQETFKRNLLMGVDTILERASVNEQMYTYVVDFLIGGFEAIGFENGLEHIATHNKLDELCVNTERLHKLQNKIELINKLAVGQKAPAFEAIDIEGKSIDLYEVNAKRTLLFFWASWCPHCKDLITELNELSSMPESDFQIVGVSIDTSMLELLMVMDEYKINWPIIAELEGWEGQISNLYGIVATPSIFLLGEDKTILAKPTNKKAFLKLFD